MSSKNQQPVTKQQLIIERWEQMRKDSAGASELAMIQEALVERFGVGTMSPAAIARTLAEHGARLSHPEILEADRLWRERQQMFSAEELTFNPQGAVIALVEKLERRDFEIEQLEQVRQVVRRVKSELDLLATKGKSHKDRDLAKEYAQWLTVWLQNPEIFAEWAGLRRGTVEFQERFGS